MHEPALVNALLTDDDGNVREVSGAAMLKRGVYFGRSRSRFQRTWMSLNSNVAVKRPHIVMNYCLFIQTIIMAIAIATVTTARNVKSKKSAVIN
jgi:hypothetical protein